MAASAAAGPRWPALKVDDNLLDRVYAGVSDGKLRLGLKPGSSVRRAHLQADVTAPGLSAVSMSGAADVHLSEELAGRQLKVTASGGSALDGPLRVDDATLLLSGAARMVISGVARHLLVQESGASRLEGSQLRSTDLEIQLSGASSAPSR